ncbi:hypothetical protein JAO29_18440 [Edaphobacter sp. HDX4]
MPGAPFMAQPHRGMSGTFGRSAKPFHPTKHQSFRPKRSALGRIRFSTHTAPQPRPPAKGVTLSEAAQRSSRAVEGSAVRSRNRTNRSSTR